jgi:hypothetical protein
MAAPIGNKYWQFRESHGRDLEYPDPVPFLEKIIEYFEKNDSSPWLKPEQIKKPVLIGVDENTGQKIYQTMVNIPTERPMSITALCDHLGIILETWKNYGKRDGYSHIVARAEQIIWTQQWEGSAVGAFNSSIIARTLGLVDKSEKGYRDKDGKPADPPKQVMIINGKEIEF